jgi:catechol 2,3-dioxygenase-like lactoylglutathione lyase family enzyme
MYSHVVVGSDDIAKSKRFYDAIFQAIGGSAGTDMGERLMYSHNGGMFMVSKPINGEPACHANGGTIGFTITSEDQAHAWHDAGVASGGTTCEDPPGLRDLGFTKLYLAYLRDPDGNKLCVMLPKG